MRSFTRAAFICLVLLAACIAPAAAQESVKHEIDNKQAIYNILSGRKNLPNLGERVVKPNLGMLDYNVPQATLGSPIQPNLDLLNYGSARAQRPNYMAKGLGPSTDSMAKAWQQAIDAANQSGGLKSEGTWSINDMVNALSKNFREIAAANSTKADAAAAAAANGTANVTASRPTFAEFASSLACKDGLKLTNCSGPNPCKNKRCGPASVCIVDQCGGCSAKCISYLELGAGLNKLMGVVGMKPLVPGVGSLPTPNLPIVDKVVGSAQELVRQVLPKCQANALLDLNTMSCKSCAPGSVAAAGATACTVCGRGRFADLKSSTCKACNPGYYAAGTAGNRFCSPCAVNTYNNLPGQAACLPCTGELGTKGLKGQTRCVRQV